MLIDEDLLEMLGRDFAAPLDVEVDGETKSKLTGDIDYDAVCEVAAAATPVPGGVGPMTIVMLMSNTLRAARLASGLDVD